MRKYLLLIAIIIGFAACSTDKNKRDFVAGCIHVGNNGTICSCLYDEMSDSYSEQDFEDMNKSQQFPPDFQRVMNRAADACR